MTKESNDNKKLLIIENVEDDPVLRGALKDKLSHEGFSVVEAPDGEEGLELAVRDHPDLILLDILMPKMDGLTMMKKLRQDGEWGKKVPIILLTNLTPNDEKINQAITDYAPAYYIVKSNWSIGDLVEKIRERLSRKF